MESWPVGVAVMKPQYDENLVKKVGNQVKRIKQAQKQKHIVLAYTSS